MTGRIDHNNYEAWLLDRLEGNLTPGQEQQLDAFLAANPGLDPGLGELPTVHADDAHLASLDKDALKRDLPPKGMPAAPIDDFLIAQLEGDLSAPQLQALQRHLAEHPELAHDQRLLALCRMGPGDAVFADKAALHRAIPPQGMPTMATLDDFLVARMEGDLDAAQDAAVQALVDADAEAARAWALYAATRVQPTTVVFPDKAALKRGAKVLPLFAAWGPRLRMAAAIALLIGVGLTLIMQGPDAGDGIAGKQDAPNPAAQATDDAADAGAASQEDIPSGVQATDADAPGTDVHAPQPKAPVGRTSPRVVPALAPQERDGQLAVAPVPTRDAGPAEEEQVLADAAQPTDSVPVGTGMAQANGSQDAITAQINEPHGLVNTEGITSEPQRDGTLTRAEGIPLGAALAGLLRERILEREVKEPRALEPDDAVAAIDKGLRYVGGEQAGFGVERRADGSVGAFDLRLGRNLAIRSGR